MKLLWIGAILLMFAPVLSAQPCVPEPNVVSFGGLDDTATRYCAELCRDSALMLGLVLDWPSGPYYGSLPLVGIVPECLGDSVCGPSTEPDDSSFWMDSYAWSFDERIQTWYNRLYGVYDHSPVCIHVVDSLGFDNTSLYASAGGCIAIVQIGWEASTEDPDLYEYQIWRQWGDRPTEPIMSVPALHPTEWHQYQAEDRDPPYYEWVTYTLALSTVDGHTSPLQQTTVFTEFGTADDLEPTLPSCVLHANYPNPFNAETRISYVLERPMAVRLAVFDVLGREVAVLADALAGAGLHDVSFAGRDLASGVYFYRLQSGTNVLQRKMLLLR